MKVLSLFACLLASASASHLDDIEGLRNFKHDHVMFKTKKDCALDGYPDVSILISQAHIYLFIDETILGSRISTLPKT